MVENAAYHQLKTAVQDCYAVFSHYSLNRAMDYCPCCHHSEENTRITSVSLQLLSPAALEHYAITAISTWGSENDFKHFLPRLLEILAFEEHSSFMGEIILAKIQGSEVCTWAEGEQEMIQAYLFTLWQFMLSVYPSPTITLEEFLNGMWQNINKQKPDITPYLQLWVAPLTPSKIHHLVGFINDYPFGLDFHLPKLKNWLVQPTTKQILEAAFFSEPQFEQEISDALHLLESYYPEVMI